MEDGSEYSRDFGDYAFWRKMDFPVTDLNGTACPRPLESIPPLHDESINTNNGSIYVTFDLDCVIQRR